MTDDNDILQSRMIADEQRRIAASEPALETPVETDAIKQQALNFALKKYGVQARDEDVIKAAAEFEKYLRGNAS